MEHPLQRRIGVQRRRSRHQRARQAVIGWRAFYADGRRFSSAETSWRELPATGLVGLVVHLEPPYRRIIAGHDWVWMDDGEIVDRPTHEEWGRWMPPPVGVPVEMLKRGAGMADTDWSAVQGEMMESRTWP